MQWLSGLGYGTLNSIQNYFYKNTQVDKAENRSEIYAESTKNDSLTSLKELIPISIKAFNCFKNNWDFDNFWKRANTCDACVCFVDSLLARDPHNPEIAKISSFVQEMLEKNLTYFTTMNLDDKWLDDFGWCG